MNKSMAYGLLAVGIVLLVFGIQASNAFSSEVSKAFTGEPTDRAMWLIAGGVLATVAGIVGIRKS